MNKTSLPSTQEPDFWAPRPYFRDPIPEIFEAAELLSQAVDAHLVAGGRCDNAGELIKQADMQIVWDWTDSICGPEEPTVHRRRPVKGAPKTLDESERDPKRKPSKQEELALIKRDGHQCRFCGIPVIHKKIRVTMRKHYPDELRWGDFKREQHAAFQCMLMQFDHIVPHSRGGRTDPDNLVVTCAPCNYGRIFGGIACTIEETGLIDPRTRPVKRTNWDGLERFLKH